MLRESSGVFACPVVKVLQARGIVEIATSGTPTDIREQKQSVGNGFIGQPIRRRGVKANSVYAGVPHFQKIVADLIGGGEWFAILVRPKGPVGDPFDPEPPVLNAQETSLDDRAGIF